MTGQTTPPRWVTDGVQLVAAIDGPLAGQWWTAEDWAERVRAAERMAPTREVPSPTLDYRQLRHELQHPHWPIRGTALGYRPGDTSPGTSTPTRATADPGETSGTLPGLIPPTMPASPSTISRRTTHGG
jgi:hypothetical protein